MNFAVVRPGTNYQDQRDRILSLGDKIVFQKSFLPTCLVTVFTRKETNHLRNPPSQLPGSLFPAWVRHVHVYFTYTSGRAREENRRCRSLSALRPQASFHSSGQSVSETKVHPISQLQKKLSLKPVSPPDVALAFGRQSVNLQVRAKISLLLLTVIKKGPSNFTIRHHSLFRQRAKQKAKTGMPTTEVKEQSHKPSQRAEQKVVE